MNTCRNHHMAHSAEGSSTTHRREARSWVIAFVVAVAMLAAVGAGFPPEAHAGARSKAASTLYKYGKKAIKALPVVLGIGAKGAEAISAVEALSADKAGDDIAATARRSTVRITSRYSEEDLLSTTEGGASGWGVIVGKDGDGDYWIATTSEAWGYYGIEAEDNDGEPEIAEFSLEVQFHDGRRAPALLLLDHELENCAYVCVSGAAGEYPLAQTSTEVPAEGQTVYALGSLFTKGMVAATVDIERDSGVPFRYVLTDLPVEPGDSGGPLLDARGWVVGLNSSIDDDDGEPFYVAPYIEDVEGDLRADETCFFAVPLEASELTDWFKN